MAGATTAGSLLTLECQTHSSQPGVVTLRHPRGRHTQPIFFQFEHALLFGADKFDIPRAIDARDPLVPFETIFPGVGDDR